MRIGVCCSCCRPDLVPYVIYCFEQQTHKDTFLVILDDNNLLLPTKGSQWEVLHIEHCETLGDKRNACAEIAASKGAEALVVWDDDDIYYPWGLEATNAALELAEFSRPSLFCWHTPQGLKRANTWGRPDKRDKALQCGWGVHTDRFLEAEGYPSLNVGEDMQLALRLEALKVTECDPIELGYYPWYVWGPWKNQHISDPRYDYSTFVKPEDPVAVVSTAPPGFDLQKPYYCGGIAERGFKKQDWYEDVVR